MNPVYDAQVNYASGVLYWWCIMPQVHNAGGALCCIETLPINP